MENTLTVLTQGVKVVNPKEQKVGYVNVSVGHVLDNIVVDAFERQGRRYTPREIPVIQVYQNGTLVWEGDKYELYEKLKAK